MCQAAVPRIASCSAFRGMASADGGDGSALGLDLRGFFRPLRFYKPLTEPFIEPRRLEKTCKIKQFNGFLIAGLIQAQD